MTCSTIGRLDKVESVVCLLRIVSSTVLVVAVCGASAAESIVLDLEGSIRMALDHNLGYERARESLALSESSLRSARAAFVPRAEVVAGHEHEDDARNDSSNDDSYAGVGVTENFVTGGSVSAGVETHRYEAHDTGVQPYGADYVTSAQLSVRQPLLRGGFVTVATAPLVRAQRNLTIDQMSLDLEAQQLVVDVYSGYYQLVKAELIKGVRDIELEIAERSLRDARVRKGLGDVAGIDIYQAQLRVSQAQDALASQTATVESVRDSFRVLLHLDQDTEIVLDEDTQITTEEIEEIASGAGAASLIEEFEPRETDIESAIAMALERRHELKQVRLQLENSELSEVVARDEKGPTLDLVATFNLYDTGSDYADSLGLRSPRSLLGVEFSYPIGNISEHEAYARARISRRLNEINEAQLRESIVRDVRSRLRQVQLTERRVHLLIEALEVAARTYNGRKILYDAGEVDFRLFSDAQKDLIDQLIHFFSVLMDYKTELVRLDKATGQLDIGKWMTQ